MPWYRSNATYWICVERSCDTGAEFLIGINSKLECDLLLSKSITQLAPVLLPLCTQISVIVASLRLTAIANCRQHWLVQARMTSLIAVAYVIEACLFVSHATFAGDGIPRAL